MFNFLGTTKNFAFLENVPYSMTWKFLDVWTGEPIALDGVTFSGRILVNEGEGNRQAEIDIVKGEVSNCLVGGGIGLSEGRWPYEVFCASDEELRERIALGTHQRHRFVGGKLRLDDRPYPPKQTPAS